MTRIDGSWLVTALLLSLARPSSADQHVFDLGAPEVVGEVSGAGYLKFEFPAGLQSAVEGDVEHALLDIVMSWTEGGLSIVAFPYSSPALESIPGEGIAVSGNAGNMGVAAPTVARQDGTRATLNVRNLIRGHVNETLEADAILVGLLRGEEAFGRWPSEALSELEENSSDWKFKLRVRATP